MEYVLHPHPYDKPLNELPRADAREAHEFLMSVRHYRIEQLQDLLAADGILIPLEASSLQPLNDWFIDHVELRNTTREEYAREAEVLVNYPDLIRTTRLKARTESLITDISLFIGELLISQKVHLFWKLVIRPKRDVAYHQTALAGFRSISIKDYHVNYERVLVAYAYWVADDKEYNQKEFMNIYESGLRKA